MVGNGRDKQSGAAGGKERKQSGATADGSKGRIQQTADRSRGRSLSGAVFVLVILLSAYLANGDFLPTSDAVASTYMSISLLTEGNLTFTPEEYPFMFDWRLETGTTGMDKTGGATGTSGTTETNGTSGTAIASGTAETRGTSATTSTRGTRETRSVPIPIHSYDQVVSGRLVRDLVKEGVLYIDKPHYYLTPTTREGIYANTFSLGSGLTALPVFLVARAIWGADLIQRPDVIWYAGKFAAALCVALSGLFVYLISTRFVPAHLALLTALGYGLGTCVWTLCSQALWQHGPNLLFLAAGTYFFLRTPERTRYAVAAGLSYGWAVACRPTSLIVVAAVGVYLSIWHRSRAIPYLLSAFLIGVVLALHNCLLFGSPFTFGQTEVSVAMAEQLTGAPDLWATPLWKGILGLLISPSRGLLIYSPVVFVALWGLYRVWSRPDYHMLRPLSIAVGILWLVAFKWYDWWGGWSFGYRPLVDTMVLLCLFALPVLNDLVASSRARLPLLLTFVFSVAVQVLGAFTYNSYGWNNRTRFEVVIPGQEATVTTIDHDEALDLMNSRGGKIARITKLDVCRRQNLDRLWSITDSQLLYYFKYPLLSREYKHDFMVEWLERYSPSPPSSH